MPDTLTSAEVEMGVYGDEHAGGTLMPIEIATIKALAQSLADSPCPVCGPCGAFLEAGTMFVYGPPDDDIQPCPHCKDFPEDRRGKAFEKWQDAVDSLNKGET